MQGKGSANDGTGMIGTERCTLIQRNFEQKAGLRIDGECCIAGTVSARFATNELTSLRLVTNREQRRPLAQRDENLL